MAGTVCKPTPTKLCRPSSRVFRLWEAEDVHSLTPALVQLVQGLKPEQIGTINVHIAQYFPEQLGRKVPKEFLDLDCAVGSLAGRKATFPASWPDADKEEMALGGFVYNSDTDGVWCFVCGVELQEWMECGPGPQRWRYLWKEHADLVPQCRHLARYRYHSGWPLPGGTIRRSCSEAAGLDMIGVERLLTCEDPDITALPTACPEQLAVSNDLL